MKKINKKIAAIVAGVMVVAIGLPFFAAFEAHIINVRAHIENALHVGINEIDLGILFPNETNTPVREFDVELSTSFKAQQRVKDVSYFIRCKSKGQHDVQSTWRTTGNDHSREYWNEHNLCPYLDVVKDEDDNDGDSMAGANLDMSRNDILDGWLVSVPRVPSFLGFQSQADLDSNWPTIHTPDHGPEGEEGEDYGADLWIETTGFSYFDRTTD